MSYVNLEKETPIRPLRAFDSKLDDLIAKMTTTSATTTIVDTPNLFEVDGVDFGSNIPLGLMYIQAKLICAKRGQKCA